MSEVVRISTIISFICVSYEKPSSSYCVMLLFLVRLQGKFDIEHSLGVKV